MGSAFARPFDTACPRPQLTADALPLTRACLASAGLLRAYDLLTPALGRSDFCELRQVRDRRTNELHCLRTFNGTLLSPDERQFLKGSFETLARLDHPNLLKVHSVLESADGLCVLCDAFPSLTLQDHLLAAEGRLPATVVFLVLSQLFSLLAYLHSHGVSYGNFEPKELLFNGQTVKVHNLEHSLGVGDGLGTPMAFAAPETVLGGKRDLRADYWSLGVLAYTLLTGRQPFASESPTKTAERVLRNKPVMPVDHLLVSEEEKELLGKLLVSEPGERVTPDKATALRFFCAQGSASQNRVSLLLSLLFKNGSSDATVDAQTTAFRLLYVCWTQESFQWLEDVVALFRVLDGRAVGRVTKDDVLTATANDLAFRGLLLLKLEVWGRQTGYLVLEAFVASFLADLTAVRPSDVDQFVAQFPPDPEGFLKVSSLAHAVHPALMTLFPRDEKGVKASELPGLLFGAE